jgi:phosphoglycolate phosphatase
MRSATTGRHPAVIFDLDGTLVDSAKGIAAALDVVRAGRGMGPVGLDDVRRWVSLGAEELVANALGATPASAGSNLAAFRSAYAKVPADPDDLYPGTLDVLRALAERGFRQGVCTNKPQALAANIIEGLGLGAFVSVVVGGSPDLRPKPHPESLHLVMDRLKTAPTACLYVGDSEVDAETAQLAGVPFVLVGHGYAIGPQDQIKCIAAIENLGDLLALADSLA